MIRQLQSLLNTPKKWQKSLAVAVLCLLFPLSSYAIGLGGLKLKSTLDQKLDASIEILSISEQELSELSIKLATPAVYERMGIDRTIQLEQLRFSVIKGSNGKNFIHVSTPLTVTEPFLNFLIEVNWASGRLIREFTVLLDPPVFLDEEGGASVNKPETGLPPVLTTPEGITETTVISESKLSKSGDTDIDAEISKILSGEETAFKTDVAQSTEFADSQVTSSSSLVYEEVKQNEILWRIADKMRPENITVEQMMLALKRENPQAFFGDNVSMLKAGAVLRIEDTSTLDDVSVEQAILDIEAQHQEWLAYRKERQAKNAVAAESANLTPMGGDENSNINSKASTGNTSVADVSKEPLLKLVAPVNDKSESNSDTSNAALEAAEEKVNELNIELVMATEELEARKRENEDLVSRLNSLEEQMSAMQSIVQLKDAELAKLRSGDVTTVDENSTLTPLKVEMLGEDDKEVTVTKVISEEVVDRTKKLWQDPLTIGTGIFAILLVALIGVLLKRKSSRKSESEVPLDSLSEENRMAESEKTLDDLFPEDKFADESSVGRVSIRPSNTKSHQDKFPQDTATATGSTDNADSTVNRSDDSPTFNDDQVVTKSEKDSIMFNTTFELDDALTDLEPMTDMVIENSVFADSEEELLDAISEADVYLTYEKYEKAEKLLKDAIQSEPDRHELKLKLLEVYAEANDKDSFSAQADEFYAAINGNESHPLWSQALNLANLIGSDNPLFSDKDDLLPTSVVSLDKESGKANSELNEIENTNFEQPTNSSSESKVSAVDNIDEITDSTADTDWTPDQVTEFVAQDNDSELLDSNIEITDTDSDIDEIFDPTVLDEIDTLYDRDATIEDTTIVATSEPESEIQTERQIGEVSEIELEEKTSASEVETLPEESLDSSKDVIDEQAQALEAEEIVEAYEKIIEENALEETKSVVEESAEIESTEANSNLLVTDELTAEGEEKESGFSDEDLQKAMSAFTEEALAAAESHEEDMIHPEDSVFIDSDIDSAAVEVSGDDLLQEANSADTKAGKPAESAKKEAFGDTSFFLLSDEVGTKLDLARAYIEMGDHEGASDLLNEVLSEGNQRQKLEAKALMEMATA